MTEQQRPGSDRPLSDRTALITGGSRGIGAATARRLAALGADLVITFNSRGREADELAAELRDSHGVAAHPLPYDLTADASAPSGVEALLATAADLVGDIDVVVSNASAPYPKDPLPQITAEELTRKVELDVANAHRLVTGTAPRMLERGFGRIVLVGSMHAEGPTAPGMTASGVSKAALAGYLPYAVDALTGPGVTINLIHPGFVATDATRHLPAAVPDMLAALTPSGHTGVPDDIAGVVATLCRPESGFLNGAVLPVAGGLNHPVALPRLLQRA